MTKNPHPARAHLGDLRTFADDAINQTADPAEWIVALRHFAAIEKRATEALRLAVDAAREQGASWADVGAELGVSRSAAHQRFGG
jgi:hypothetical protein